MPDARLDPGHTYLGLETAEIPSERHQLLAEALCQGQCACHPAELEKVSVKANMLAKLQN